MKVALLVRRGPTAGSRVELDLGRVEIGREPGGPSGVLLPGDLQVSRLHGELRQEAGMILYRNLSPNGTRIDRALVQQELELSPGAELQLGGYLIEVQFKPERRPAAAAPQAEPGGSLRSGPLARPAVRAGLALYLLAVAALAVVLGLRGERTIADEFAPVRRDYLASYRPAGVPPEERRQRLARAERLVDGLMAGERSEAWETARAVCRELMALDGDAASPIYRFAARRLGALAGRG